MNVVECDERISGATITDQGRISARIFFPHNTGLSSRSYHIQLRPGKDKNREQQNKTYK
jgi:hypothetical protein